MLNDIILLGPYGSGKTTQAQRLAREFGYVHFNAGQSLRDFITRDTPEAAELRAIMARGELVSAHYTVEFLREAMETSPGVHFVIDGTPRALDQLELLDRVLQDLHRTATPLLITLSDVESLRRQVERRNCGACGMGTTPQESKCPACGSTEVTIRPDNNPEIAAHRVAIYHAETDPVVSAYRERGMLLEVDGEQPVEAVTAALIATITPPADITPSDDEV